jgi:putative transposase
VSPTDVLVRDKNLLGLVDDWAEYLRGDDQPAHNTLLRAIRTGRPAGSEQFVKLVEKVAGRDLSLGKPGRPTIRAS